MNLNNLHFGQNLYSAQVDGAKVDGAKVDGAKRSDGSAIQFQYADSPIYSERVKRDSMGSFERNNSINKRVGGLSISFKKRCSFYKNLQRHESFEVFRFF